MKNNLSGRPVYLCFFLISLLLDLLVRSFFPPLLPVSPLAYFLSALFSALFWMTVAACIHHFFSTSLQKTMAALVGFALGPIIVINAMSYAYFREYLAYHHVMILGNDWKMLKEYLLAYGKFSVLLAMLLLSAVTLFFSYWLFTYSRPVWSWRNHLQARMATVCAGFFLLFHLNQIDKKHSTQHLLPEARVLLTTKQLFKSLAADQEQQYLHRSSYRLPVEAQSLTETHQKPPLNVLWILNESLGKQKLKFYGYPQSTMPFFENWIKEHAEQFFIFDRAYSNAAASDVSLPSMFTGVASYESNKKLHQMPLIWHWAKAMNLSTFFLIPITRSWCGFERFFFGPEVDIGISREQLGAPAIKDLAADELILANKMVQTLAELPKDKGFFGVYYAHSTHLPFQDGSDLLKEMPPGKSRYERALYILDHAYKKIFTALAKSGRIENTVIIFNSDHGEMDLPIRDVPRLFSHYREIQEIPMMLYLPKKILDRQPLWSKNLKANRQQIASNIDWVPTLAEIWGLDQSVENQKILEQLLGKSLLRPLSDERHHISLNSSRIKQLSRQGFAVYWKHQSLIYEREFKAFDLLTDPWQKNDLWPSLSPEKRSELQSTVAQIAEIQALMK